MGPGCPIRRSRRTGHERPPGRWACRGPPAARRTVAGMPCPSGCSTRSARKRAGGARPGRCLRRSRQRRRGDPAVHLRAAALRPCGGKDETARELRAKIQTPRLHVALYPRHRPRAARRRQAAPLHRLCAPDPCGCHRVRARASRRGRSAVTTVAGKTPGGSASGTSCGASYPRGAGRRALRTTGLQLQFSPPRDRHDRECGTRMPSAIRTPRPARFRMRRRA